MVDPFMSDEFSDISSDAIQMKEGLLTQRKASDVVPLKGGLLSQRKAKVIGKSLQLADYPKEATIYGALSNPQALG